MSSDCAHFLFLSLAGRSVIMAVEAWRTQASFPFLASLCDIDPDVAVGEPFTDELLVELRRVTAATVVCPPEDKLLFMELLERKVAVSLQVSGVNVPQSGSRWMIRYYHDQVADPTAHPMLPPNTEPISRCGYAVCVALAQPYPALPAIIANRVNTGSYPGLVNMSLRTVPDYGDSIAIDHFIIMCQAFAIATPPSAPSPANRAEWDTAAALLASKVSSQAASRIRAARGDVTTYMAALVQISLAQAPMAAMPTVPASADEVMAALFSMQPQDRPTVALTLINTMIPGYGQNVDATVALTIVKHEVTKIQTALRLPAMAWMPATADWPGVLGIWLQIRDKMVGPQHVGQFVGTPTPSVVRS